MTRESNELALCLINENTDVFPYEARCSIARNEPTSGGLTVPLQWAALLERYADWYQREYEITERFAASTILAAAAEVAEYYERHVAEMDAVAR